MPHSGHIETGLPWRDCHWSEDCSGRIGPCSGISEISYITTKQLQVCLSQPTFQESKFFYRHWCRRLPTPHPCFMPTLAQQFTNRAGPRGRGLKAAPMLINRGRKALFLEAAAFMPTWSTRVVKNIPVERPKSPLGEVLPSDFCQRSVNGAQSPLFRQYMFHDDPCIKFNPISWLQPL